MNIEKLTLLTKVETSDTIKILHEIIDHICGRPHPSYKKYGKLWDLEQWWDMNEEWGKFCKHCTQESFDKDQIYKSLDSLQSQLQQDIADAIYVRKNEIKNHLVTTTCNLSKSYLKDFDWQLKLVMSSDKLANIQEPLVSLNLDVVSDNESKPVSVEMDKESLKKLITSLELANKAVSQLQT